MAIVWTGRSLEWVPPIPGSIVLFVLPIWKFPAAMSENCSSPNPIPKPLAPVPVMVSGEPLSSLPSYWAAAASS